VNTNELIEPNHSNSPGTSPVRAWWYMVWLSWRRQARAHGMVWIALGLLAVATIIVFLNTYNPRTGGWRFSSFSRDIVFGFYSSFLLPMWTLSFATEALGRERSANNLIWLLTRPLGRAAIFLGKYLAVLPWCLALNLGGFALLCSAAGEVGRQAFAVYWPAILGATFAYAALFHLLGAAVRRPAVLALLYAFFIEAIVGNLPGHLKRLSVAFYTRCLMYDRLQEFDPALDLLRNFSPVSATTAWLLLAGGTALLLLAGTILFTRSEIVDG
jgi:ABC-2 type transport system permease protein